MSDRIQKYQKRLAEARIHLEDALDLIGDRADEQIYSEGAQWTLRQLAIHLALADKGHNGMVMHYAQGKAYIPPDYDLERYNKSSVAKRADMTLEQARESMHQSRAELLAWLEAQEDDAFLDREGRHATLQIMTVAQIFNTMAYHEKLHADDIIALLAPTE